MIYEFHHVQQRKPMERIICQKMKYMRDFMMDFFCSMVHQNSWKVNKWNIGRACWKVKKKEGMHFNIEQKMGSLAREETPLLLPDWDVTAVGSGWGFPLLWQEYNQMAKVTIRALKQSGTSYLGATSTVFPSQEKAVQRAWINCIFSLLELELLYNYLPLNIPFFH